MMNELSFKVYFAMQSAKTHFVDFLKKEKGSSEIIAVVVVIAIVLVLAAAFWDKIADFFGTLWKDVIGKNPVGGMSKDDVVIE